VPGYISKRITVVVNLMTLILKGPLQYVRSSVSGNLFKLGKVVVANVISLLLTGSLK
jgi:hypothetical protein